MSNTKREGDDAKLARIARLALDAFCAKQEVAIARLRYHQMIDEYEEAHGKLEIRLDPNNPRHAGAIEYSAKQFSEYQAARKSEYNIKRRLENACRNYPKF